MMLCFAWPCGSFSPPAFVRMDGPTSRLAGSRHFALLPTTRTSATLTCHNAFNALFICASVCITNSFLVLFYIHSTVVPLIKRFLPRHALPGVNNSGIFPIVTTTLSFAQRRLRFHVTAGIYWGWDLAHTDTCNRQGTI